MEWCKLNMQFNKNCCFNSFVMFFHNTAMWPSCGVMANFEGNLQSKTSIHIGNALQLALSCKQKSSVCLLENVCGWLKTTKTQIFLLECFALYSSTFSYLVGGSLFSQSDRAQAIFCIQPCLLIGILFQFPMQMLNVWGTITDVVMMADNLLHIWCR